MQLGNENFWGNYDFTLLIHSFGRNTKERNY